MFAGHKIYFTCFNIAIMIKDLSSIFKGLKGTHTNMYLITL